MTENGLDSLPFEPSEQEQENVRPREENARMRRFSVHGIPIPQLVPEPPPPTKHVETIRTFGSLSSQSLNPSSAFTGFIGVCPTLGLECLSNRPRLLTRTAQTGLKECLGSY